MRQWSAIETSVAPPVVGEGSAAGGAACEAARAVAGGAAAPWRASLLERLVQAVIALGAWTVLAVAFSLHPSPDGLGTHEQLGFQPCAFYQITGRPCPGCGLTTAFAFMAHGHPLAALVAQPFGVALFILALLAAGGLTATAAMSRSLVPWLYRINVAAWLYGLIFLWLGSWIFKIAYGMARGRYGL